MKTLRYVFSGVILLLIMLSSCVKESAIVGDEGQPVQITFRTGTRSGDPEPGEGDPADRYINSLRVLGYRVSDGTLAFNEFLDEAIVAGAEKRIDVVTGRFTVVFIANEHSDEAIGLGGLTLGTSTLSELDDISFSQGAFLSDNDIPMVRIKKKVIIQGDKRLIDDGTSIDGVWEITMERLGVRVDLTLDLDGHILDAGADKVLTIKNVPNKVYLFQKNNYEGGTTTVTRPLSTVKDVDGNIVWRRIILPESMFPDKEKAENAVELSLWIDNQKCTALIGLDTKNTVEASRNYTLPRNTYLDITATANPQQQALDCSATVVDWTRPAQNVIADGPYWLTVDKDELIIPAAGGSENLIAETNYENILPTQGYEEGIVYWTEDDWITLTPAGTKTNRTISVSAEANSGSTLQKAKIYVQTGNMTKVINVMQGMTVINEVTPMPVASYVGAFWRADQTGERLIRINNAPLGDWTAWVYDYGEEFPPGSIVFSTAMSNDLHIGWRTDVTPNESLVADMNESANDTKYSISGSAVIATGTVTATSNNIFFRIGLKSKWTPTEEKPARYAVIVLSYSDNTKHHKIWLRQGHDPDYLMNRNDAIDGWGMSASGPNARPAVVRFSPYNLTNANLSDSPLKESNQTGLNGGVFTDYPSQGGAFYQWANKTYVRYAYHPTQPQRFTGISTNWNSTNISGLWGGASGLGTTHETCPKGYLLSHGAVVDFRRPTDGIIDKVVGSLSSAVNSEMRQSLFEDIPTNSMNPTKANSEWGFYADGFYDRRIRNSTEIGNASDPGLTDAIVSFTKKDAAYAGRLVYNPATNASLFFPIMGARDAFTGQLSGAGGQASYWSCSILGTSSGYTFASVFSVGQGGTNISNTGGAHAFNIRCVTEW